MNALLAPFSWLYTVGTAVDRAVTTPRRLPRPVISVGNLTWGGTGKTPTVIALVRYLLAQGRRPAVLTRGYGRRGCGILMVGADTTPAQAGDEPFAIARECPQAVVMVGADRAAAARRALREQPVDIFILDDGFQHWALARDLDIVCVNAGDPFGNGRIIPAGILREPLSALARAGLVLLNRADSIDDQRRGSLRTAIGAHTAAPLCETAYALDGLRRIVDGVIVEKEQIAAGPVTAVSAIGDNAGFERTLARAGFRIAARRAFRDHHRFSAADILSIGASCAGPYLATAKDAVKLAPFLADLRRDPARAAFVDDWYQLDIHLSFMTGEQQWRERIQPFL